MSTDRVTHSLLVVGNAVSVWLLGMKWTGQLSMQMKHLVLDLELALSCPVLNDFLVSTLVVSCHLAEWAVRSIFLKEWEKVPSGLNPPPSILMLLRSHACCMAIGHMSEAVSSGQ